MSPDTKLGRIFPILQLLPQFWEKTWQFNTDCLEPRALQRCQEFSFLVCSDDICGKLYLITGKHCNIHLGPESKCLKDMAHYPGIHVRDVMLNEVSTHQSNRDHNTLATIQFLHLTALITSLQKASASGPVLK